MDSHSKSRSDPLSSLRSLYAKAARAFLHRNMTTTQMLIDRAFEIIPSPPPLHVQTKDLFVSQRKKWDILRITLETTVYTTPQHRESMASPVQIRSPSPGSPSSTNNNDLRSNILLSPPSLLATLHTRSLRLFSPQFETPSPSFLPPQILLSLVLAALKLDCPQVGRGMVEEWLARRSSSIPVLETSVDPSDSVTLEPENGYAKVIDVYCLHLLPKLGEWDYALQFIEYETELSSEQRQNLTKSIKYLHIQSQIPTSPPPPYANELPTSSVVSSQQILSRPNSRASSASTASNQTAVPKKGQTAVVDKSQKRSSSNLRHRLGKQLENSEKKKSTRSRSPHSQSSTVKPTKSKKTRSTNLYHAVSAKSSSSNATSASSDRSSEETTSNRETPYTTVEVAALTPSTGLNIQQKLLNALDNFKANLLPYLKLSNINLPLLVCVVIPLLAFLAQVRRLKRRPIGNVRAGNSAVEEARRKLGAVNTRGGSGNVWSLAWRAVQDTVTMASKGLV